MSRQQRRSAARHPFWRWPPGSVLLGYTPSGKSIFIPAEMRALGCHVIGLPGQGKSRVAEGMLRQDYLQLEGVARGAVLLDPHGTLYGNFLRWYTAHGLHRVRPIRVLDPSDPNHVFHLNPLRRRPGVDPAVVAGAVTNAVLQVWGGDATATPQLRTTLKHTFFTLCELGLPLCEAANLLDLTDASGLRSHAAEVVRNPVVRQFWRELDLLRMADREARVGSAMRRLTEFLLPARVRAIFSEASRALDWRQVMDDGEIVLVNLAFDSGSLSEDEAQVIGVMMLAEIFLACQGRPEGALPFYIYLDECHRFLTPDIAKVITEGRKFGVHAGALMHQVLAQLREAGDFVFGAVMAARTKIVFGGLEPDDAEHMARSIFRGQFDLQRDKARFRKPVVVGQELAWLLSESEGEGSATAEGKSYSHGASHTDSRAATRSWSTTHSTSDTASRSTTRTEATTDSVGKATSRSQSDQWSLSSSQSTSASSSDTRSSSSGASMSVNQEYSPYSTPDYRLASPAPDATVTDGFTQGEGAAATVGQSTSSGSAESFGRAMTQSESDTRSSAKTRGVASTTGTAHTEGIAQTEGYAETVGTSDTLSWSAGESRTQTRSVQQSHGASQALRSVFELLPGQSYSLEELLYLASVRIANLKQGEAIVKIGRRPSAHIKTLRVPDGWSRPERVGRLIAQLAESTPYITRLPPPSEELAPPLIRLVPAPEPGAVKAPTLKDDGWG